MNLTVEHVFGWLVGSCVTAIVWSVSRLWILKSATRERLLTCVCVWCLAKLVLFYKDG